MEFQFTINTINFNQTSNQIIRFHWTAIGNISLISNTITVIVSVKNNYRNSLHTYRLNVIQNLKHFHILWIMMFKRRWGINMYQNTLLSINIKKIIKTKCFPEKGDTYWNNIPIFARIYRPVSSHPDHSHSYNRLVW